MRISFAPKTSQNASFPLLRRWHIAHRARRYSYMDEAENQLHPVMSSGKLPLFSETIRMPWVVKFLPGFLESQLNSVAKTARQRLQKATFRFDKFEAYRQLFIGRPPDFIDDFDSDVDFAWRRIAGPNPLSLRRATSRADLASRLVASDDDGDAPIVKLEALLVEADLDDEIAAGRVFFLDYAVLMKALRPEADVLQRDTRWRRKYLPAPVAIFWENPDRPTRRCDLVPLLIQVDQKGAAPPNRVYYRDGSMGWRIAKLYVEVADENFHVACGHVLRTHLTMDPFCMASYRCLSRNHPVHVLLEPHLRYTLGTNKAAYKNFVKRDDAYFTFYAGTLEELRQVVKDCYADWKLCDVDLESELEGRGVEQHPAEYPYRDDMRLYRAAIDAYVRDYVSVYYTDDADVALDHELQSWAAELVSPEQGNLNGLFREDEDGLLTVETLVRILGQVIYIAGPNHASQHFSQMHYYRYPPAFSASAYAPPPSSADGDTEAHWRAMMPPLPAATLRYTYSHFGDFRFDRFGRYLLSRVGWQPETRHAVRGLQSALEAIEEELIERDEDRYRSCFFYRPSKVPNSINI